MTILNHFKTKIAVTFWVMGFCGVTSICAQSGQRPNTVLDFSPDHIRSILVDKSGTKEAEQQGYARHLQLFVPGKGVDRLDSRILCPDIKRVKVSEAVLMTPGHHAVLEIDSPSCQYVFLVVLKHNESQWSYIDTMPLWSKDIQPETSLESLVDNSTQEIVVRGVEVDYGTGIFVKNFMILKLFPEGLRVVMDEPKDVSFEIPSKGRVGANARQRQKSQFKIVRSDEGSAAIRSILEEQTISDHNVKVVRWWLYTWSPEVKKFRAYPTLAN